jgi:hypothetical protein
LIIKGAINSNIYDIHLLQPIYTEYFDGVNIEYNGAYYYYQQMMDIRYPDMAPIICIFYNETANGRDTTSKYPLTSHFCFYNLGIQLSSNILVLPTPALAIPIFNHYGWSPAETQTNDDMRYYCDW